MSLAALVLISLPAAAGATPDFRDHPEVIDGCSDLLIEVFGDDGRRVPGRRTELPAATPTWVDWFNHRRALQPIGNIPPAKAEERYRAMLEEPAMAG